MGLEQKRQGIFKDKHWEALCEESKLKGEGLRVTLLWSTESEYLFGVESCT